MISKNDIVAIPSKMNNRLGTVQEIHNNVTCTTKFLANYDNVATILTEDIAFQSIEANIDKVISIDKIYDNVSKKT